MKKTDRLLAGYLSPCSEVIEGNFEAILCASEDGTTEQFDNPTDYEW